MTPPAEPGHTGRNVLIGVLALGIALTALVLVVSVTGAGTAQPTPVRQPTNTPNIGAGGITPIDPGDPVPAFTLPASTGGEWTLDDLAGQYTFLYFGYTECPDYCPTTMAKWVQVKQRLGDSAEDVGFVMVSIDPRRDSPEVLAEYLGQFDPSFVGLQANEVTVRAFAPLFGLSARVPEAGAATAEVTAEATAHVHGAPTAVAHDHGDIPTYLVDHTVASYLIDPEGRLRAIFAPDTPAADMAAFLESIRYADESST